MILRTVLAAKLHGLCVTDSYLYYSGSITLPGSACEEAGLHEGDEVAVYNFENGNRYETYVIQGAEGVVVVNGPSARLSQVGDRLVVAQYVLTDERLAPKILFFDRTNRRVAPEAAFPGRPANP